MRAVLRLAVAPLALTAVVALASAAPAAADSGYKCHNSDSYGSSCIFLHGSGLELQDVQAYFVPPNRDYMSHRRWAFKLTRYPCDPRGKTQRQCRATKAWYSRIRRGNPPKNSSTCVGLQGGGVSYQQCVDEGLAYADANNRSWRRFYRLPHQFRRNVWFCSELAFRVGKHWRVNGAAGSAGDRGCAEVHD